MLIAKVVGTVVATRKDEKLEGVKFLLCKQLDIEARPTGGYVVTVDSVGAGLGEVILFATGSSARQTKITENRPVDAVIMAIVDTWEVDGVVKYQKVE
ncbi:MAG: EutN/CcmL family microcompartment protein [Chloroflexota bacterium]|jgi:ethanolamine utilization protein EutN/carbon dioxide concentrating mechanism protein CcmL